MTAPTLNDDPDLCLTCRANPASTVYGGRCPECFARAVWFLDPPPWAER